MSGYHRKPEDDHMIGHLSEFGKVMGLGIAIIVILSLFSSCSSTLATTYDENGTKVITKTVYVPSYYPVQYNSFYNPYGIGYNNFFRPIYRPYRARPLVRTRTVRPARRVVKPAPRRVVRPVRSVRPTRSGTTGNTLTRVNKGRRQ